MNLKTSLSAAWLALLSIAPPCEAALTLDIGTGNTIVYPGTASGILIVGTGNYINGNNSAVFGYMNFADNTESSLVTGQYNNVWSGSRVFVSGSYNAVWGEDSMTGGSWNVNNSDRSVVVGYGNSTDSPTFDDALVAGRYNATVPKNAFLVIGNGFSASSRRNAFVVYQDGDVYIRKAQGDIPMGNYQN